jgi:membrane protein YqaA with SNARE-associated domain
MSDVEILFFIIVDSFTSNLFFIINYELAVWVAQKLSTIDKLYVLSSAFLGVLAANICNYIFGILIFNIFKNNFEQTQEIMKNQNIILVIYKNFYFYLIILAFIPIYSKFMVLFAGYLRFRPVLVILGAAIIKTVYYGFAG